MASSSSMSNKSPSVNKLTIVINYEDFFDLPQTTKINDRCVAKCKHCGNNYKYSLKTKANLLHHLQSSHDKLLKEYQEKKAKPESSQVIINQSTGTLTLKPFLRQDAITQSIVKNLIGKGLLPISIVEAQWFKDFMHEISPNYTVPSRYKISENIDKDSKEHLNILITKITDSNLLPSLTIDCWSGRNHKSYIGGTIHYIFQNELLSSFLFLKELPPPHTAENIRNKFEDICSNFKLTYFVIATDNGANIKKAFQTPIFMKTINSPSASEPAPLSLFQDNTDSESEVESDVEEESESDLNSLSIFLESIKCCAHTLQLVVHDGISSFKNDILASQSLEKCKKISKLCAKSIAVSYSLQGVVPPQSCVTRLSSDFRLIKHILTHSNDINTALQIQKPELVLIEFSRVKIFRRNNRNFKLFSEATDILEAEKSLLYAK